MTVQDLVNSTLRLIGVLASGEIASAAESFDGMQCLNDLLDSLSAQRLGIFEISPQTFPLVPGTQAYTLGTGGNFNTPRPPAIDRVSLIITTNPSEPLELPVEMLTTEEWQNIPVKNVPSAIPYQVWDDQGFPLRTLRYFPVPSVAYNTSIYSWQALTKFTGLNQTFEFPSGYAKAIRFNLALELCPEYGRQPDPVIVRQATESLAAIKIMNAPVYELRCDPALTGTGGYYDWRSDTFR